MVRVMMGRLTQAYIPFVLTVFFLSGCESLLDLDSLGTCLDDSSCPSGQVCVNQECVAATNCGNGKVDTGELCEGADCPTSCAAPPPNSCFEVQLVGEVSKCNVTCVASEKACDNTVPDGC